MLQKKPIRLFLYFVFSLSLLFVINNCSEFGLNNSTNGNDDKKTDFQGVRRLKIVDDKIFDEYGQPIRLRGGNLDGITQEEALILSRDLRMNFVRLRLTFNPENRGDNETGLSETFRNQIDEWIRILAAHKIWMVLEMRGNDNVTNDLQFYTVTDLSECNEPLKCPNFIYYLRAWKYLVQKYKDMDYVAGYGLLAEPSANHTRATNPHLLLIQFQKKLMDELSLIDDRTPFFIGPDFNYDTMQYRYDEYFTQLSQYKNRMVYAVNFLAQKPWINEGVCQVGGALKRYPFATPVPLPDDYFNSLLTVRTDLGENYKLPEQSERVFEQRKTEPGNCEKTLTKEFIGWYLKWALDFKEKFRVPFYVDQFGAGINSPGHLDYDRDLILFAEQHDLHWTRWSYNGSESVRNILDNPEVFEFYRELLQTLQP